MKSDAKKRVFQRVESRTIVSLVDTQANHFLLKTEGKVNLLLPFSLLQGKNAPIGLNGKVPFSGIYRD